MLVTFRGLLMGLLKRGREATKNLTIAAVVALITFGALVTAVVQARFTMQAVDEARKSANAALASNVHAARSFEADARGWVLFARLEGVPRLITSGINAGYLGAPVVMKNYGKSPARYTDTKVQVALVPDEPDSFPTTAAFNTRIVSPGAEGKIMALTGRRITPEEGAAVESRRVRIYVWGDVSYVDIFDTPRRTRFCGYTMFGSDEFIYCSKHNDWK